MPQSHPSVAPISLQGRCSIVAPNLSDRIFWVPLFHHHRQHKIKFEIWNRFDVNIAIVVVFEKCLRSLKHQREWELILTRGHFKNIFSSTSAIIPSTQTRFCQYLEKAAPSNIDCVLRTFLKITCTSLLGSDYHTNIKTLAFLCLTISQI